MTLTFDAPGDFRAASEAEQWLRDNGYSVGWTCGPSPRGILKGEYDIAKWRNLTDDEIAELDGRMIGNMRHGPVTITIHEGAAS